MSDEIRSAPTGGAAQTTAREFLAVMFRRKWIIVGLFAVTTLTVLAISLSTPLEYISSGRVLFKRGEQMSVLAPDRRLYGDWEQEMGSEVEIVKSVPVLERARALLAKETPPGQRLVRLTSRGVDAEVMGKSNVIAIGYRDADPRVAEKACDALLRAYVEFRQGELGPSDPKRFFEQELARVESELTAKSEERRRYTKSSSLVDPLEQSRSLLFQSGNLEQTRSQVVGDLAEARANMDAMRSLQERTGIDLPMPSNPVGVDVLYQLKQKILDQEARVVQLRERYRDESPEITNALETLQGLKAMLKREVESRLEVLSYRTEVLTKRLASVDDQLRDLHAQMESMPDKETRLAAIDHDIDALKTRYKDLAEKSDLAHVNENTVSSATIILLSPAARAIPTNARDYVRVALAPAFSLVVGIGLAFFIDGLDITVHTAHHAEAAVELPVLATLPDRGRRRRAAG